MKFIPQLNSLRAIAVLMVIISHYYPATKAFSFGESGVDIFFYLSGFLITSLMIRDKEYIHRGLLTKKSAIFHFYIRRALRIFPLYYAVVIVLYLVASRTGTGLKNNIGYFLFYMPNYYFYNRHAWDGMLSHFWSLGVEEQYYLIWPFVFFFSRDKFTRKLLYAMTAFSFLFKFGMSLQAHDDFYSILTVNCIYKFGLGAITIFALDRLEKSFRVHLVRHTLLLLLLIAAYVIVLMYPFRLNWIICDAAVFYFFVYSLTIVTRVKAGGWYRLLSNRFLVYIGTISYGMYVLHLIMPWLVSNVVNKQHWVSLNDTSPFFMPLCFVVCIALSALSYRYFESYFLRLKTKFSQANDPKTIAITS